MSALTRVCSQFGGMLRLTQSLLKSVVFKKWIQPHPITWPIKSIRESRGSASIKPDAFCPCPGTQQLRFSCLGVSFCFFYKCGLLLHDKRFWSACRAAEVLFNASKIEVCRGRGWVEAANLGDCMSCTAAPTGRVVRCRLEGEKGKMGEKKQLFLL